MSLVHASMATAKQPRRYQDRSRYLGPQWTCKMCEHMNEGNVCSHCAYAPELLATPGAATQPTFLARLRDKFFTTTQPMRAVGGRR